MSMSVFPSGPWVAEAVAEAVAVRISTGSTSTVGNVIFSIVSTTSRKILVGLVVFIISAGVEQFY